MYGFLANGVTSLNIAQGYNIGTAGGGALSMYGINGRDSSWGHATSDGHAYLKWTHYENFGHTYSYWFNQSSNHDTSDADFGHPNFYTGYSNTYRSILRAVSRINQIYDTNASNKHAFKKFSWITTYSSQRARGSEKSDTAVYNSAFLKCFCTTKVDPWQRGTHNEYIDSMKVQDTTGIPKLVADPGERTFAEVGLFMDSSADNPKNYAALVVNTRMYPSLRDADDSGYYNKGFEAAKDSTQRCRSIYGDIDVRKFWFKIDTSKFDPQFQTQYYVVRDLWHPDSTWLVKNDSNFAIYIKPGDAKFLYIEKGISIRASATAFSPQTEFTFNNGRRVAERMKGTRSVVTYTRDNKLYVSYPAKGSTFEGYNEHSAGDNIASGFEECLDSSVYCRRPSICVAQNDSAVAIIYWTKTDTSHRLKAAYQKSPSSPWHFATYFGVDIPDSTTDGSGVTPVLTPHSDTSWWVAAGYWGNATTAPGIIATRFKVFPDGSIQFYSDPYGLNYFYKDTIRPANQSRDFFPTIASRPMDDTLFPVRLAWQRNNNIYYNRYKQTGAGTMVDEGKAQMISYGLNVQCNSKHPSIALNAVSLFPLKNIVQGGVQPAGIRLLKRFNDYVVWESILSPGGIAGRINSRSKFWPVMRTRSEEYLHGGGSWGAFQVFKPDTTSLVYHYPIVTAAAVIDTNYFTKSKSRIDSFGIYHDYVRIAWYDFPMNKIEFAHYLGPWYNSSLLETGYYPSLALATDSVTYWKAGATVPASVAFISTFPNSTNNEVRITNGFIPKIGTVAPARVQSSFTITVTPIDTMFCKPVTGKIDFGHPSIIRPTGNPLFMSWTPVDVGEGQAVPDSWPAIPLTKVEIHSDSFTIHAQDTVVLYRTLDTMDLTSVRNALTSHLDYFIARARLLRWKDSSYIATIDSMLITKDTVLLPGITLNAGYAKYKYPTGASTDTAFIALDFLRGDTANTLHRSYIELLINDSDQTSSYKKSGGNPQSEPAISMLKISVIPNPFNQSTTVKIKSTEGLPTHIEVFDLLGKKITDLYNDNFPASPIEVKFEAAMLSTGSYLVRVQSGNEVVTRKIEFVK